MMRFLRSARLSLVAILPVAAACYSKPDTSATGSVSSGVTGVTYHHDIEPIVQKHCQSCHVAGGIAPFPLTTYSDAKSHSAAMASVTSTKTMPPWGAESTSECTPRFNWRNDIRLTESEIALFTAWRDGDAPEGDAVTDGSGANDAGLAEELSSLPNAQSLTPTATFAPVGTGDTLRCFVLDPAITTTKFMTGSFFVPKNRTIVHHALAFAIPAGAKTPAADSWDCFGGPQVDGASLVAAWAPGGVPTEFPSTVALPLEAGTRFVMQVHYHPHVNASTEPDATTFQYQLSDTIPDWLVFPKLIGNFSSAVGSDGNGLLPGPDDPASGVEFLIPADVKDHTETMTFRVPATLKNTTLTEVSLLGVGAHMHLVGVDEKISVSRAAPAAGEPAEECLIQEPHWNFDWQRIYQYDAPLESLPKLRPGDNVNIRCTYDNTLDNLNLGRGLSEQQVSRPVPVSLGESTLDEMCLGAFFFLIKRP